MADERRFDLAELDAEAVNLDLLVEPPENSMLPSGQNLARSPVRYMRPVASDTKGSAMNFCAVRAGAFA